MLHTELIASVPELLERHAVTRPEKVAYWDTTRSVTYRQLAHRTAAVATSLTKMGVREGDKIALFLPNGLDWIEACFACLRGRRANLTRRRRGRDFVSSRRCELPHGIHKCCPKKPCRETVRGQKRF
jgi:long-subunit acyl-CoA synthetase (AMP-forming)